MNIFPARSIWLAGGGSKLRLLIQKKIDEFEPRIRRRLRGKLRSCRHVFDTDDLMSSLRLRIDKMLVEGRFTFEGDASLQSFANHVAENVAREAVRRESRQQRRRERVTNLLPVREEGSPEPQLDTFLIADEVLHRIDHDEQLTLRLWVDGVPHTAIAAACGLTYDAHRARWRRLQGKLRSLTV